MKKIYYLVIFIIPYTLCSCMTQYYGYSHFVFADNQNKIGYALLESKNDNFKILIREVDSETAEDKQAIKDYIGKKKQSPNLKMIETPFKISNFAGLGEKLYYSVGNLMVFNGKNWEKVKMIGMNEGIQSHIIFKDKTNKIHISGFFPGTGLIDAIMIDDYHLVLNKVLSNHYGNIEIFEKDDLIVSSWSSNEDENNIILEIKVFNGTEWGSQQDYKLSKKEIPENIIWKWDIDTDGKTVYILLANEKETVIHRQNDEKDEIINVYPPIPGKITHFWKISEGEYIVWSLLSIKSGEMFRLSSNEVKSIDNEKWEIISKGRFSNSGSYRGNLIKRDRIDIMKPK